MKKIHILLILTMGPAISLLSQTVEVNVTAAKDNTIFKNSDTSNGIGEYIFAGTDNNDVKKRALVKFNLEGTVPEGVVVDSAQIVLVPSKVKPGSTTVGVYALTTDWGEGTSKAADGDGKGADPEANDATWDYAKFNTDPWIKKGGDYEIESSATSAVSLGKDAVFSSVGVTADINYFLQNPSKNFGWIFIGDESKKATSVKFISKDHNEPENWPKLKLYYKGATSASEFNRSHSNLTVYQGTEINKVNILNSGNPVLSSIVIYSITGSRIYANRMELTNGENTIFTAIQEPGIYIYQITSQGKPTSGKLMILDR